MTSVDDSDGLQLRYIIQKADGTDVDPLAEYFVLRLDPYGDPIHVEACRKAALCYANEIEPYLPKLAADIKLRYGLWES